MTCALFVSLEAGAVFQDNLDPLESSILDALRSEAELWLPRELQPPAWSEIGLRDVRDYKVASGGSARLNTASPFNVKLMLRISWERTPPRRAVRAARHEPAWQQSFVKEIVPVQLWFWVTQRPFHASRRSPARRDSVLTLPKKNTFSVQFSSPL